MTHEIKTYNASGKIIYTETFETAEEAYKGYAEIIENLQTSLPKGYETTVVRYRDGYVMGMTTIVGMK